MAQQQLGEALRMLAWIAGSGFSTPAETKDFARKLRIEAGADHSASGATRVAGTTNYKRKYEPDFPTVRISQAIPRHIVTKEQLEAIGLVAPSEPETVTPAFFQRAASSRTGKKQLNAPRYGRIMPVRLPVRRPAATVAVRPEHGDFTWCMTAIDWGFPIEETVAKLPAVNEKARERGQLWDEGYPLITA